MSSTRTTFYQLSTLLMLLAGRLVLGASNTTYQLQDNYDGTNFFDGFDFYSGTDPTHGFVDYLDEKTALKAGLAGYSADMIYLGVDHTSDNVTSGRASTRVSSTKTYTKGLFLADINHMPTGCGVWPAFWMFGQSDDAPWPQQGEIDILEGVNSQVSNAVTLHTSEGCTMGNSGSLTTTKLAAGGNCNAPGDGTTGCPQSTMSTQNYGKGFNAGAGGIYAAEWTDQAISVWFFPRNSSQANALSSGPSSSNSTSTNNTQSTVSTANFGTPLARFDGGSGCDIDTHFSNHSIILNTALCGDWAGSDEVWAADETCSALAPTCQEYVAGNGADFVNSYWLINSIKVYQQPSASAKRSIGRAFVA